MNKILGIIIAIIACTSGMWLQAIGLTGGWFYGVMTPVSFFGGFAAMTIFLKD